MSEKAYITPVILKWARESAKFSIVDVASKLKVKIEKIENWENGIEQPTISQAQKMAKLYKRSFAIFFLPEIPSDFQPLQDFRKKHSKELGTSSVFIIRELQQRQAWTRDLYLENNEKKLSFVGKFSIYDNPKIVAENILKTFNINPNIYSTNNPIKEWIDSAESNGIFISRTSYIHSRLTLDSNEIQGFAISDEYAPFIFINSDDWNAPQLFTLVHELAHIWIAKSGISNAIEPTTIIDRNKMHPIEIFCNEVAANALLPDELMYNIDRKNFINSKEIYKISKKHGVSSLAFIVRALNLNLISLENYSNLKRQIEIDFKEFLKKEEERKQKAKEKEGGPSYYLLQLNRNSRLFTQTVLDAFKNGFIEPTIASNLLNIQINKFPKLEAQMFKY